MKQFKIRLSTIVDVRDFVNAVISFDGDVDLASGRYVVDGKVTSLNSFLSPDSEYYEITGEYYCENDWLADVDGSFGENDSGIFFFTPDGNYYEWTGTYLYTDVPVEVDDPVIHVEDASDE